MMKRVITLFGFALLLIMTAPVISAQEGGSDLDALFGEEVVAPEVPSGQNENPLQGLLKTEAVRIGGSMTGSVDISGTWNKPWSAGFDLFAPDSQALTPVLKGFLYVDARPDEEFRVHGSFKTAWPFFSTYRALSQATLTGGALTTSQVSIPVADIRIFELFSDFQLGKKAYLRFGKATVKWGVGYFFSPADIINLQQIDLYDPTAQREGPLQFRILLPFGKSQNTATLYAIFDTSDPDFSTTALAAKVEFVLGRYELGISSYYRHDTAERAALTLTGPLGKFDVFAEGVISRGSPKTFYSFSASAPYYSASGPSDHRPTFYPSATAGFLYNDQNSNLTIIGQYYYNGEGYSESERNSAITTLNTLLSLPLPDATKSILTGLSKLYAYGSGLHYAAVSFSYSEIGGSALSASTIGLVNLSDVSGLVQPSVSWKFSDRLKLTGSARFFFGGQDTEYGVLMPDNPVVLSVSLSAGTGNF